MDEIELDIEFPAGMVAPGCGTDPFSLAREMSTTGVDNAATCVQSLGWRLVRTARPDPARR